MQSRGRYITFVDSDDWVTPKYLSTLYETAEREKADVVKTGAMVWLENEAGEFYRNGGVYNYCREACVLPDAVRERLTLFLQGKINTIACAELVRRELFTEKGLCFEEMQGEDVPYHFWELMFSARYVCLPQNEYNYRMRKGSVTHGRGTKKAEQALISLLKGLSVLEKYLQKLPEVAGDEALCIGARRGMAGVLFHSLFLKVSKGIPRKELMMIAARVFAQYAPEQAGLLFVLLEEALEKEKD